MYVLFICQVYGSKFSLDQQWYRCMVEKHLSEKDTPKVRMLRNLVTHLVVFCRLIMNVYLLIALVYQVMMVSFIEEVTIFFDHFIFVYVSNSQILWFSR